MKPALPRFAEFVALVRALELRAVSRWVGLGVLAGVFSGAGAAAFYVAMDLVRHVVLVRGAALSFLEPGGEPSLFGADGSGPTLWWLIVLAPALGGLASGLIVWRFAPEAEGHGTDAVIDAFHRRRGDVRPRVPAVKAVASALLIGTGGSAGREGPIAQIGAGLGSLIARQLTLSVRERRLLMLAGAAGGIGAIFRTPLGAALFVVEVLYRDDMEVEALVPAVFASVTAYSLFTLLFGSGSMFTTPAHFPFAPSELPFYAAMAIGAAIVGVLYTKTFYGMRDAFSRMKIPRPLKPMLGGLSVGCLALAAPQVLGAGYGWLQQALLPSSTLLPVGWAGASLLLGLALAKVLATALSVGSGGSGGVFGPSVVIGGMLGGAFGHAFHAVAPEIVRQPGTFVIVGMACFVGGVAHAPISSLVLATEMTGSYDLLVPIMLAEGVTFAMMRRFTLYEKQLGTRRDSPAHAGDYLLDVLGEISVADSYRREARVQPVPASTPLLPLLHRAASDSHVVFPVVDDAGRVQGMITLDTLRALFYDEDIARVAIAADCATPLVSVTPEDTLTVALQRLAQAQIPELPVVSSADPHRVIGLLDYHDVVQAYGRELARRRLETDGASDERS